MNRKTGGLLLFLLAFSPLGHAQAPVSACAWQTEIAQGGMPDEACQGFVAGFAYGLDYASRRQGFEAYYCLPPEAASPANLYNGVLPQLQRTASENKQESMNVAIIVGLMKTYHCEDKQPDPDFRSLALGNILVWCKQALDNDTESEGCSSYLFGVGQAMRMSALADDSNQWFCPPEKGVSSKEIIKLALDASVENPEIQQRDAVEVIGRLLQQRYPCR